MRLARAFTWLHSKQCLLWSSRPQEFENENENEEGEEDDR